MSATQHLNNADLWQPGYGTVHSAEKPVTQQFQGLRRPYANAAIALHFYDLTTYRH